MAATATIALTANSKAIRILANTSSVPGIHCDDRTIQICQIKDVQNFMDNVTVDVVGDDKILLIPGEFADIGGTTDLDTTTKIRTALISVLGW